MADLVDACPNATVLPQASTATSKRLFFTAMWFWLFIAAKIETTGATNNAMISIYCTRAFYVDSVFEEQLLSGQRERNERRHYGPGARLVKEYYPVHDGTTVPAK